MIKFIFGDLFRFFVCVFVRGARWQKNKTNKQERETPRDETGKENQI